MSIIYITISREVGPSVALSIIFGTDYHTLVQKIEDPQRPATSQKHSADFSCRIYQGKYTLITRHCRTNAGLSCGICKDVIVSRPFHNLHFMCCLPNLCSRLLGSSVLIEDCFMEIGGESIFSGGVLASHCKRYLWDAVVQSVDLWDDRGCMRAGSFCLSSRKVAVAFISLSLQGLLYGWDENLLHFLHQKALLSPLNSLIKLWACSRSSWEVQISSLPKLLFVFNSIRISKVRASRGDTWSSCR